MDTHNVILQYSMPCQSMCMRIYLVQPSFFLLCGYYYFFILSFGLWCRSMFETPTTLCSCVQIYEIGFISQLDTLQPTAWTMTNFKFLQCAANIHSKYSPCQNSLRLHFPKLSATHRAETLCVFICQNSLRLIVPKLSTPSFSETLGYSSCRNSLRLYLPNSVRLIVSKLSRPL